MRRVSAGFVLIPLLISLLPTIVEAGETAEGSVTISTKFPGGNLKIEKDDGNKLTVSPDLRGDNAWFYWYFEATAEKPGRVTFIFPEKVIGFKNGAIGFQGPAISQDLGKTWRWMGTGNVNENAFFYDFKTKGERVRFAVTIPYLQSDLQNFLTANEKNEFLTKSVLTKSNGGREVELIRIGKKTTGKKDGQIPVLITARHHATETIASYVVEGFMQEAMSESDEGKAFREKYVLYAVPFVDKDGVEEGDQGKNRKPHDHNRDYGENSIYPEVQAIKKLQDEKQFGFAIDFHCPTLVMDIHQVMYFVGAKAFPKNNLHHVTVFAQRIKNELPQGAPVGPLVWLRDETKPSPKNSRYFAFQKSVIMSATLEIPFSPPKKLTDPASCRKYGTSILRAFVGTEFSNKKAE